MSTIDDLDPIPEQSTSIDPGNAASFAGAISTRRLFARHLVAFPGPTLPAAGVTVHAQDPGGAALNLTAGFTNPLPRRTLVITRGLGGPGSVDYTVTMRTPDTSSADLFGEAEEVVAVAPSATGETEIAGEVVSVTTTVDPVSTTDFATGDGFSINEAFKGSPQAPVLSVNGVVETPADFDAATGTIVPTTVPDGALAFVVAVNEPA